MINNIFNKRIIVSLLATITILFGVIFGTSKIYAEGEELTDEEVFYAIFDTEKMVEHPEHRYVPVIAREGLFDVEMREAGSKFEIDLTILDAEILDLIKRGINLEFDFTYSHLTTEKIKLYEFNQFELEMEWLGTGENAPLEESEFMYLIELIERFADRNLEENTHFNNMLDAFSLRIFESDLVLEDIIAYYPWSESFVYADQNGEFATIDTANKELYFENFYKYSHVFENSFRVDNGYLNIINQENSFEVEIGTYYDVDFVDGFGNIIDSQEVVEGGLPKSPNGVTHPENPEKYKFVGWDSEIERVYEEKTYTAQFEINKFIVEFYDDEGNLIETQEVDYGTDAIAPNKNLDKKDRWFKEWDSELNNITENKTITAIYDLKEIFTINFKNVDGSIIQTLTLYDRDKITAPRNVKHPENEAKYKFTGWDQTIDATANKDVDYIAEFEINKFTVKFLDLKGKVIDTQVVEYGESAVYPEFEQETIDRILTGWEGEIDNITSNQSFKATFETKELFFITFKNIDGSIIEVLELYKGQPIKAPLATFISDNELFEYVFKGWDKELDETAEKDVEYIAEYELTKRFRLIFKNVDGSIIAEEIYLENEIPKAPKNVEHPTEPEKYKFIGFVPNLKPVSEDTEYIALYEVRSLKVRFYFENQLIDTQTILYGENATPPNFEIENVTFKGWDKDFRNVTEDIDIFAIYEENQSYEITIKVNGKLSETIKFYESIYQFDITKYLNQNKNYKLVEVLDGDNNDYIVEEGHIVILDGLFENYEINIIMEIKDTYKVTYIHFDGTEEIVEVYEGDLAPNIKPSVENMIFVGWVNSETLEYDDLRKPVNSDLKYFLDYKERDLTLDVPIFEKEDALPGAPWRQNFTIKKPGAGIDNYKNHQLLFAMNGIEDFDEIVYITVTIKHTYQDGGGGIYFPGFEGTRKGFYVYEADKDFSIRYLHNPGEFKGYGSFGWMPWITGSTVKEYTKPAENVSGWGDGYIMNNLFAVETEFTISFATKEELDKKPELPGPGTEDETNDGAKSMIDKIIDFIKKYLSYIIFILITIFILNMVSSKLRKNNRNRKRNKNKSKRRWK